MLVVITSIIEELSKAFLDKLVESILTKNLPEKASVPFVIFFSNLIVTSACIKFELPSSINSASCSFIGSFRFTT